MKKTITLMAVLFLAAAPFATAGILDDFEIVLDGTTVNIIGLGTSAAFNPTGFGVYFEGAGAGTVSTPVNEYATSGDLNAIAKWSGFNGVDLTVYDSSADSASIATGAGVIWFDFQYDGQAGSVATIYDYTVSDVDPAGTIDLQQIPEPMTMALLGLGGLFLRKRKKA